MKTAICYYSRHHGNTKKVLDAMTEGQEVDWIDVTARAMVNLTAYDRIGFASGIYYGKYHEAVVQFARQYLPENKKVFLVFTHGAQNGKAGEEIAAVLAEKHAVLLGEYQCRGWDTFGPFRLLGGIAKGHPTTEELASAKAFYHTLAGASDESPYGRPFE